ncbi:histidine--tRNA ligase [Halorutilales archaeon Cl-col2-1]
MDRDLESLKGFRDFYPDEMAARREVFDTVEETARSYGFREIATPSLEPLELYEIKSGEEIVDETYSFEDKGGRQVTMAPELTPSVVRIFVAKQQEFSKPLKWYSVPKLWRYEQPQSGRLREFYQPNFDIFGGETPEADAEIVSLADDMLRSLGLDDDFVLRMSHRKILQGIVEGFDLPSEDAQHVYRTVDKTEKLEADELRARLREVLDDEQTSTVVSLTQIRGFDSLEEVLDISERQKTREGIENLRAIHDRLADYGVDVEFDPRIVRGLDYYTGAVFECFDTEGDLRSIFGGGRYDDLVETFGGQPTPAVGFAPGDATLELLMKRAGVWPDERIHTDYYVAVIGDVRQTAVEVAQSLRAEDNVVEIDLSNRGFSGQLEYADSINAEKTVIVGERDLSEGVVTVKEMETGDQKQVPLEEFA